MSTRTKIIGVMGSHENEWLDFSTPAGKLIAERGYHLLTGAGGGVMTAVSKAYSEVEGRTGVVIGIHPAVDYKGEELSKKEFPNPYIDVPIITPLSSKATSDAMPYSRNLVNVMSSDALVILPGSHGTHNEVSIALIYGKPLVMFGPDTAFNKFPEEPLHTDKIEHVAQFFDDVFGE